ncbi:hypothetical protein PR048_000295 [Dryococelus australis]|uniref:Uncharacterized protein n=1 Tax=Dryococelus australis TaxID=614101 RepID=A0ABQ9IE75_9NEOP|nr:hypothetical protein PR048_000295 [Dryococelus australis]
MATVAERLACSPPTKAIRVQSPDGSSTSYFRSPPTKTNWVRLPRIFARGNRAGRCCRLSAGFTGDLECHSPLYSVAVLYSPRLTLSGHIHRWPRGNGETHGECKATLDRPATTRRAIPAARTRVFQPRDPARVTTTTTDLLACVPPRRPTCVPPPPYPTSLLFLKAPTRVIEGVWSSAGNEGAGGRRFPRKPADQWLLLGTSHEYFSNSFGDEMDSKHLFFSPTVVIGRQLLRHAPFNCEPYCICLRPASFLDWLLYRCEDTPSLTELHVIGAHNCEVFLYWDRVTQDVSHKLWSNDKRIAKRLARSRLPSRRSGFNPRPGHSTFSHVGIVLDDAVGRRIFSGISHFPPALSLRHCSVLNSITLIGSQDPAVKSRPDIFTSLHYTTSPPSIRVFNHCHPEFNPLSARPGPGLIPLIPWALTIYSAHCCALHTEFSPKRKPNTSGTPENPFIDAPPPRDPLQASVLGRAAGSRVITADEKYKSPLEAACTLAVTDHPCTGGAVTRPAHRPHSVSHSVVHCVSSPYHRGGGDGLE